MSDSRIFDTQWPRYEVFKQDKQGRPFEAIGTVHASDAEIALQNARDVHVRRPDCHEIWVAPERAILKITAQQLENGSIEMSSANTGNSQTKTYQIFIKKTLRRSMIAATHVGELAATSPEAALTAALAHPEWGGQENYVWWVVPDDAITRSADDDILSMFEPASRKTYKQQSRYGLIERSLQK